MEKIRIKHNPYTINTDFFINDKPITEESQLTLFRKERFQVWIDELIPKLFDEINSKNLRIEFHGTQLDFEDLQEIADNYNNHETGYSIELIHKPAKETADKIKELEILVSELQEGPIKGVIDSSKIMEGLKEIKDYDFEISVIATMSSGKSTLINSFLGYGLMPTQNEACTATIFTIKNIDGFKGYRVKCHDQSKVIEERVVHTPTGDSLKTLKEFLKKANANENVSRIAIECDMPYIKSKQIHLVLIDTPGPNIANKQQHGEHTTRIIDKKSNPMVLYILNATQLEITDDSNLLQRVSEEMKKGGKQSRDRFLFIINKVDQYDPEKECIEDMISNARRYLEDKLEIKNPNIFPVSALLAYVIRGQKSGELTKKEKDEATLKINSFIEEEQLHLEKYASLSEKQTKNLSAKVKESEAEDAKQKQALLHSGIPSVETAINIYLEKYAHIIKITNLVNVFEAQVEEQNLLLKIEKGLSKDDQKTKEINQKLQGLKAKIEDGSKAKALRKELDDLKNDHQQLHKAKDKTYKMFGKFKESFIEEKGGKQIKQEKEISSDETKEIIQRANRDFYALQNEAFSDIEKIFKNTIEVSVKKLINRYTKYVKDLVEISDLEKVGGFKSDYFTVNIPAPEELIKKYEYAKEVVVGEKRVPNEDKKWYKPWTWGEPEYYRYDVTEKRPFVNLGELRDALLVPLLVRIEEVYEQAEENFDKELASIKEMVAKSFDELDQILLSKVTELEELSSNKEMLEKRIKDNEKRREWLKEFIDKKNKILEI